MLNIIELPLANPETMNAKLEQLKGRDLAKDEIYKPFNDFIFHRGGLNTTHIRLLASKHQSHVFIVPGAIEDMPAPLYSWGPTEGRDKAYDGILSYFAMEKNRPSSMYVNVKILPFYTFASFGNHGIDYSKNKKNIPYKPNDTMFIDTIKFIIKQLVRNRETDGVIFTFVDNDRTLLFGKHKSSKEISDSQYRMEVNSSYNVFKEIVNLINGYIAQDSENIARLNDILDQIKTEGPNGRITGFKEVLISRLKESIQVLNPEPAPTPKKPDLRQAGLPANSSPPIAQAPQVANPQSENRPQASIKVGINQSIFSGANTRTSPSDQSKVLNHTPEIPAGFTCPITQEIMKDPVIFTLDKRSYERTAIEEWLGKNRSSPFTRAKMSDNQTIDSVLIENFTLKELIEEFLEKNPEHKPEQPMNTLE